MATGKRFYWIKLKDSFFTSDTVDFFMSQPNGAQYIVLYQMLHLLTANTGGKLQRQIGEIIIPYDVAKIQRDCKWFSEDTIRVALELYKKFGLVYEGVDGALVMRDHEKMVGSETDYAEKMRIYRNDRKELEAGYNVTSDVSENVGYNSGDNVMLDNRDKILDTRVQSIDTKKENNKKKESFISADVAMEFEKFWDIYSPIRNDTKSEALKCFRTRVERDGYDPELIFKCARNYAEHCKKHHTEKRYVMLARTFLGPNLRFLEFKPKEDRKEKSLEDMLEDFGSNLPSGLV